MKANKPSIPRLPADDSEAHVDAAIALMKQLSRDAEHVAQREGGAPWPFTAQRRAARDALLVAGWDTYAQLVALDSENDFVVLEDGLALAATRNSNSPTHRNHMKVALIQVMALSRLIAKRSSLAEAQRPE